MLSYPYLQDIVNSHCDYKLNDLFKLSHSFKVMELDLLSLDSVVRFAEAWNARLAPLHALINNAGIFTIGGL